MTITTEAELFTAIKNWTARDNLTDARMQEWVDLVEDDLNQNADFAPAFLERRYSTTLTSGDRYLSVPSDLKAVKNIIITGTDPDITLEYVSQWYLSSLRADASGASARPRVYTKIGDEFKVAPTPDSGYAVEIVYVALIQTDGAGTKPTNQKPLTAANANWLITNAPSVYLYGCLTEAMSYLGGEALQRLGGAPARYERAVNGLIAQNSKKKVFQGPSRMRPASPTP